MKCFFLDIDGTILPFGKPIPGSAIEAVEYARRNGNKVFVATGRAKAEFPSLDPIVFDGYVYSAGAAVSIDGKLILDCLNSTEKDMTHELAFKAAELCIRAQMQAVKVE